MRRRHLHVHRVLDGVRPVARRLMRMGHRFPVVLAYHRVANIARDPQLLAVDPMSFDTQMQILERLFEIVPLSHLTESPRNGHSGRPQLAITFDDGYVDNYRVAVPILARRGLPATFFVTTGQVGTKREFWWDELELLLLGEGRLPERLTVKIGRSVLTWDLSAEREWGQEEAMKWQSWNVLQPEDPTVRHAVYRELCLAIRCLPFSAREAVLEEILDWSGRYLEVRKSHQTMSLEELRALGENPRIAIGSHSVSHPCIAALDSDTVSWELEQSKRDLEGWTSRDVVHFAFPFGSRGTLGPKWVARKLESAGYTAAVTTRNAFVRSWSSPFRIPRILVQTNDSKALMASLGLSSVT